MATYSAYAKIDAHMDLVSKDANYGATASVELGGVFINDKSKFMRAIANFDVSALSGRTIDNAELRMLRSGLSNPGFDATIYRCTRPDGWTEGGVTWNKYDGSSDWTDAGGDFDEVTPTPKAISALPSPGWNVFTGMKDFVTDAIDNRNGVVSLIIKADDENPPQTAWVSWQANDASIDVWRFVIDHSGAPIGARRERGFIRGVQRGTLRGI